MKTLALLTVLALHTTGLWPHLSDSAHDRLTSAAATTNTPARATATASATAPSTTIATQTAAIGPLAIRINTSSFDANAPSALAIDAATGTILYTKNASTRRPIASVTKMITALVILSRHDPSKLATLPQLPPYGPYDERIGLAAGETYRIGDLVEAALVQSANDAADALALYDSGTMDKFATQMNLKMAEWGIEDTHFNNPTGLIDDGNYATAESLSKIAGLALANPFIRQSITKSQFSMTSTTGRTFNMTSTNKLLATGQFYGIKTGYTPAAGECFVGLARIDGHEVITVILGSDDRFGATRALTNWITQTYQWL